MLISIALVFRPKTCEFIWIGRIWIKIKNRCKLWRTKGKGGPFQKGLVLLDSDWTCNFVRILICLSKLLHVGTQANLLLNSGWIMHMLSGEAQSNIFLIIQSLKQYIFENSSHVGKILDITCNAEKQWSLLPLCGSLLLCLLLEAKFKITSNKKSNSY